MLGVLVLREAVLVLVSVFLGVGSAFAAGVVGVSLR